MIIDMINSWMQPLELDHARLRRLDLNLLLALDALLSEASVTRAAERMGLGQPAVSHALSRLRAVFDDPLLIRESGVMVLSDRARALAGPLREVLKQLERIVGEGGTFDPGASQEVFRVGVSAHVEAVLFPELVAHIVGKAPGVRLIATHIPRRQAGELLDSGDVNVAIGALDDAPARWHRQSRLFEEGFAVIYDADYGEPRTLRAFLDRPHALVTTQADLTGRVDRLLMDQGKARNVVYSTPNFVTLSHIVKGTPLLACLPESLTCLAESMGLSKCRPPFDLGRFTISMMWHVRTDQNPAQVWLRDCILTAVAARRWPRPRASSVPCKPHELDAAVK